MTKQYCDRCSQEIVKSNEFFLVLSEPILDNITKRYDLCPACTKDLAMFLKGCAITTPPFDPIFGR